MDTITRKATIYAALTHATLLEAVRRRDIYVALLLAALLIGSISTVGTFGVAGLELFVKDIVLTVIGVLSTLLAVVFASRQMVEEVSRRTVYPLLARPITRADLIIGKFLGAWTLSVICLLLFSLIGAGAFLHFGLGMGLIFGQYLLLRVCVLAMVCALAIALSLALTPSANITITLLLTVGAETFSQAILLVDGAVSPVSRTLLHGIYFVLPHFDLFDLSKKVSFSWKPVAGWAMGALCVYAAAYTLAFLLLGVGRFRKQAL